MRSPVVRRVLTAVIALAAAAAAFAVVGGVHVTDAAWTQSKTFTPSVTAVTPAAVPTVACGASSGLLAQSIPISWTAPAGPAPSSYRLHWQGTAANGDSTWTTTSGSISAVGLSVVGSSTVSVYARYGDWESPVSLQTVKFTTIAVVVVVSWTCGP